ncbi:LysR substrate-binding domain-containing protein [Aurantimonas sp. Leaf443]|uniref:LysR substrate-binding domain-containing protein n=1 Tax=Aurantimonas sp. Leaf443 TaxID=1736378 RepID=UPI0006FDDA57|nr:LysR substrate-binding domain-containing protein [Aurantimonas sp. Leaf443]KQT83839.1 LysR family transcriptional regulator [Aurantimonas sp. Leaf443]
MLNGISLTSIRAFEAAGRLGSFRAAAAELGLSASAVSHAILKLERALGTSLFDRSGRVVHLTGDGETLMRRASSAFDELRRGIELVSSHRARLLRLHSAPSFAAQILSPRLPEFLAANPGIEVRLAASTEYVRFTDGEFDADIVYGTPRGDDLVTVPLGYEVVTPLCTPAMAATIREPADLQAHVLIRSDTKQVRWPDWYAANGLSATPVHSMSFDRSFLAIAAAADGLGVALESTRLAQRELESGRLVAPLAGRAQDIRYIGHVLAYPRSGSQRRLARRFAEWLAGELGQPLPPDDDAPTRVAAPKPR